MLLDQARPPSRPPEPLNVDTKASDAPMPPDFAWSDPTPAVVKPRHPSLTIALHWGTFLAILISVSAMFLRDALEDDTARLVLLHVHRQLGLLVMLVAAWRIVLRFRRSLADHASDMAAVFRWAAKSMHVMLYVLLIGLPLLGWLLTSAHGISLSFLGVLQLPRLIASDSEFADTLSDYHVWLSWVLLACVAAHSIAALWHHYERRDSVLVAMLPGLQVPNERQPSAQGGRSSERALDA